MNVEHAYLLVWLCLVVALGLWLGLVLAPWFTDRRHDRRRR